MYYSGAPNAGITVDQWSADINPPYDELPTIKRQSKDKPAIDYAWRLFWNMGGYNKDGEDCAESVTEVRHVDSEGDIFGGNYSRSDKESFCYPEDWAEAELSVFGQHLEARVKWFQEHKGIPVTGVINKATWEALGKENGANITGKDDPSGGDSAGGKNGGGAWGLNKSFQIGPELHVKLWHLLAGGAGLIVLYKVMTMGKTR